MIDLERCAGIFAALAETDIASLHAIPEIPGGLTLSDSPQEERVFSRSDLRRPTLRVVDTWGAANRHARRWGQHAYP